MRVGGVKESDGSICGVQVEEKAQLTNFENKNDHIFRTNNWNNDFTLVSAHSASFM